jgi:hypothetical protein
LKRSLLCAAIGTLALAASAPPALANGFTLNLAAPSTPVVGKPMVLDATGTIPVDDLEFPYWFSLDAIPAAVTTTCPQDRWEAVQFATATGGSVVVLSQLERPDATGHFSIPVAVTPSAPGSLLLCGYTDDGQAITLAGASLPFDIQPASSAPGPSRPASPPAQAVRDIRGCRALLGPSHSRHCIRSAIKRANARCRRLPSHRRQARCLHAVRRVSRRHS